jgi:hypothetical protein
LSLSRTEEQSTVGGSSNVDPTLMKLSDNQDEQDDCGPYYWTEVETEENYTKQSNISNMNLKNEKIQRCDTILLVIGQTERQHPIKTLNNFEMFDRLGANKARLGPDDELAENNIFASTSALNWVICDWSVRKKSVQYLVQKVIKHDFL